MAEKKNQYRAVIQFRGLDGLPDGVEKIFEASGMADAKKTAKRLADELDGRVYCLDEMTAEWRTWLETQTGGL